jgi:hypothetical protein
MQTDHGNWVGIAILLAPLLAGGIITAINSEGVNDTTEKIEAWIREKQRIVSEKNGKVFRFAINPPLLLFVKFSDWTDSFENRGMKNGTRVALTLYLMGFWLFLIYFAVSMVVALILVAAGLIIAFKILDFISNDGDEVVTTRYVRNDTPALNMRGKKLFSGNNFYNKKQQGIVDKDGNIYKGDQFYNKKQVGSIDEDGNIYEGTEFYDKHQIGSIDKDGNIYKGDQWYNKKQVGSVDEDGNIYEGTEFYNKQKKGEVKK